MTTTESTTKEIIQSLPKSWGELTLSQFQKIADVPIKEDDEFGGLFVGVDNTLNVVSILSGVDVDILELLPFQDIQKICSKIAFVTEEPKPKKDCKLQFKTIEDLTYNEFIQYQTASKEPIKNIHLILRAMLKEKMTDEEIQQLPIDEVLAGFFLLRKQLKKSLRRSQLSLSLKLIKQLMREKSLSIIRKLNKKKRD